MQIDDRNWRFDVSGMTPAQLETVIYALKERLRALSSGQTAYAYGIYARDDEQLLNAVVQRLERALPANRPLPANTVV